MIWIFCDGVSTYHLNSVSLILCGYVWLSHLCILCEGFSLISCKLRLKRTDYSSQQKRGIQTVRVLYLPKKKKTTTTSYYRTAFYKYVCGHEQKQRGKKKINTRGWGGAAERMIWPSEETTRLNVAMVPGRNVIFKVYSMFNNMHLLIYLLHTLFLIT